MLHIGVCCKSLSIQVVLELLKEMEITGREIRSVARVVHNHQAVVGSMGPCDFLFLESLEKHLVSKIFSADSDVKQTVTSLLQTLDTDFFYTSTQALVSE